MDSIVVVLAANYRSMAKTGFLFSLFLIIAVFLACARRKMPENASVWNKVNLDLSRLDDAGLAGPESGKVALNYEFCIPAGLNYWEIVQKIDKTAQLYRGSRGRIGCKPDQWLVIGSTGQKNFKPVLYNLASLSFVDHIQETFFE